jgi:hypothetical protein
MHLFSGTIKDNPPDIITYDIKPQIQFEEFNTFGIGTGKEKGDVKQFTVSPTICDDVRNIKQHKLAFWTRQLIIADPPYNDNHVKYNTEKVNKIQLFIDLEECCKEGTYLAWLDSSVPIYSAKTWFAFARITVYVGANCDIRVWTIFQRTNYITDIQKSKLSINQPTIIEIE